MIDSQGILKIGDFGFAKQMGIEATQDSGNKIKGTLGYLSPEQCQSLHINFNSDVFSLGIILYEMCMRKNPFNNQDLNKYF